MRLAALTLAMACAAAAQVPHSMQQGAHRMEIALERLQNNQWTAIDPGLVLDQGDRVRFRFRTNFDGYLYVMNQSTSGSYEQLFPREETGKENRVEAGKDYNVPATSAAFRIAGPAGHEVVYWLITPAKLTDAPPRYSLPSGQPVKPPALIPRCDDAVMRARGGSCIDSSAGPRLVPRGAAMPENIPAAAARNAPALVFIRQKDTSVVSSPEPLTGPVVYEFRLAHR